MASSATIDRKLGYQILDRGNPDEMTHFFLQSSPQREHIERIVASRCAYNPNLPLDTTKVVEFRVIGAGTKRAITLLLCVGTTPPPTSLGFGFFILGALVDVIIPPQGAGFIQRPIGITHISAIVSPDSLTKQMTLRRDYQRETYELQYFVKAYAISAEDLDRFITDTAAVSTSEEFRRRMYSLIPTGGINQALLWDELIDSFE